MSNLNISGVDVSPDFLKGYTPKKGLDYFTKAEIQNFKADILEEINSEVIPAENERNANEVERTSNENIRIENELNRSATEQLRVTDENTRKSNENTRIENENNRVFNENTRNSIFSTKMQNCDNAVNNIIDMTSQYNQNSITKTNDFNSNAENKISGYNSNATAKIQEYNLNAQSKIDEYNETVAEKNAKDNIQDTQIKKLQNKVTDLEEENERIINQMPSGEASGNPTEIRDSSDLKIEYKLRGGHSQGENPSPENPVEIKTVKESVEINIQNENLINIQKWMNNIFTITHGTIDIDETKKTFTLTATSNDCYTNTYAGTNSNLNANRNNIMKYGTIIEPDMQYTLLFDISNNSIEYKVYLFFCDKDYVYISTKSTTNNKMVFTTPENAKYLTFRLGAQNDGDILTYSNIRLYKGDMEKEYIPHEEQIKIMPIQREMLEGDYIEKIEHHEWEKVVLNGTETITLINEQQDTYLFNIRNINIPLENYSTNYICTHFTTNTALVNTIIIGSYLFNNTIRVRVPSSVATTAEEFKTWLTEQYTNEIPVTIYYKSAEPEELELTEEQKEAKKVYSYKNVTNVRADNELATLEIKYKKDLDTYIRSLITNEVSE